MIVIDCTTSPPVDAMRAAGVVGVCRYLSTIQTSTSFKRILQPEYDRLIGAGFSVVLNWEFFATDWLGGAAAGTAHAAEAVRQAKALGYPIGCAIPGSADFNMTASQWFTSGSQYARAYSQGIRDGGYVAGVYGPYDVLTWCRDLGGFGMFWQTMSTAWSAGRNAQLWPGAHLWQRGHLTVGGIDTDRNDIIQANYGGTMSAHTDELIEGWNSGAEKLADGSDNLIAVRWNRTEKRIADIAAAVAALAGPAVDTHALATDIAQQLVTANTNGLTDADLSAVRAVVVEVLNSATVHAG